MGNGVWKPRTVRVEPGNDKIFPMDTSLIFERVGRGEAKKIRRPTFRQIITSLHVLTVLIGNIRSPYQRLSRVGLLLWILSMTNNFLHDGYESRAKYGYPWLAVRSLLLVTCCVGTWLVVSRTMPWLEEGIQILEKDKIYRKTLRDMDGTTKKLPYFLTSFAFAAGALQYGIMRKDQATHLEFGHSVHIALEVLLHVIRFISGVHVFYALALFWSVPTCVMLLAGYSMMEFQDHIRAHLRIKGCSLTFRKAVDSFNERVKFVIDSSSTCVVLLSMLLLFTIFSLAINAYIYLFVNRSAYLYIVHALIPLCLAAYPLSTASWVTKQYHLYLVTVVKAWVECPETDSSESETEQHVIKTAVQTASESLTSNRDTEKQHSNEIFLRIHIPDTGQVPIYQPRPVPGTQNRMEGLRNAFYGSARVFGRLRHKKKVPKFDFGKYIAFLEKVARDAGFSICGVLMTWERVSAVFFFLTSLVALFVQESIFGKAKSTIKI